MVWGMPLKSLPSRTEAEATTAKLTPSDRALTWISSEVPFWAWAPMVTNPKSLSSWFQRARLGRLVRQGPQLMPQNSSKTTRPLRSPGLTFGPMTGRPRLMPSAFTSMLNSAPRAGPTTARPHRTPHPMICRHVVIVSLLGWCPSGKVDSLTRVEQFIKDGFGPGVNAARSVADQKAMSLIGGLFKSRVIGTLRSVPSNLSLKYGRPVWVPPARRCAGAAPENNKKAPDKATPHRPGP